MYVQQRVPVPLSVTCRRIMCVLSMCVVPHHPLHAPVRTHTHARRYGIAHPAELSPEVHDMEVIRTSMSEHQVPMIAIS